MPSPRSSRAEPAVSVILCSYNRLGYLKDALAGVYRQTFRDFEVVLADDGSTDGTARWIRGRRCPRLKLIRLPRNLGPAAARAEALRRARGRFAAFLDSDDLWRPRYLETMLSCLRSPEVMVAASDYDTIDERGRLRARRQARVNLHSTFLIASGLEAMPRTSFAVVRRSALDLIDGFDEGFKQFYDDADLFCRLALRFGPAAFRWVPRALGDYRVHEACLSSNMPVMDGRDFVESFPLRWGALDARRREFMLDWVYFRHKHSGWMNLALGREPLRC